MPEQEVGQVVPETSAQRGAHDRVKRGYWPEKFGDQEVTIDLDHPQADKVRTREQLEAARVAAEREAAENEGRLAELLERERAEAEERELEAEFARIAAKNSAAVDELLSENEALNEQHAQRDAVEQPSEAQSAPPAPKPSRRR